jgi:hypothetical protein
MMMKKAFAITMLLLFLGTVPASGGVVDVVPGPEKAAQYGLYKLGARLPYFNGNPKDQDKVKLTAVFTDPEGKENRVPMFCLGNERAKKRSMWEARFTPVKSGRYEYHVELWSRSLEEKSGTRALEVSKGNGDGFLRNNGKNPFYLIFDSGKSFYGLGHNIGWTNNNSVSAFEMYFKDLKENGCNLARVWTNAPWAFPLEDKVLGEYNEKNCARIDELLDAAARYGIYIILVLDTYGSLMEEIGEWDENVWKKSPYNSENGGPCKDPMDLFTNETADKYYRDRIRYVISRWGYSPMIAAFELWNEMDTPPKWTEDLLAYIKEINPHGQLLTTSLGYPWGNNFDESSIWGLKDMDILQWHVYGERIRDVVGNLISINKALTQQYDNKPIFVGEFSMDSSADDRNYDPKGEGVALHNSIWASALTRSFSSPLNWWWAGYVKGKNLYRHYGTFRDFIEGMDWNAENVTFIETTPLRYNGADEKGSSYGEVRIQTLRKWGEMHFKEFTVKNNGDVEGGLINGYLHGSEKPQFRINPVFRVDYPEAGQFIMHVDIVSQAGRLVAYLDGKEVLSREFPVGTGEGPWQRSLYRKDENIYQCAYNTDVAIDVPAGKHTIQFENIGKDWIGIKRIMLTNYKSTNFADARVLALAVGDTTLLWMQNKEYNWRNIYDGVTPAKIEGTTVGLEGLSNGTYRVRWYNPGEGVWMLEDKLRTRKGALELEVPAFNKDIACRIERL